MSAPVAQQPKSPPCSVRRSARGSDAQAGAGDKRGGGSEVGDGASPLHPLGAQDGGKRDTKHSGNTQIRTSRLTRWMRWYHRASSYAVGQSEALTTPPHASGHRAFGAPTQGAAPWVGNSIKITS